MDGSNDLVISTSKLTKEYNGKPVLKSLDLKVPRHSIFGFLGPNGAGKTTTIKLILGLIRPTSGTCTAFGMDTIGNSIKIRHRIGYLAQDPRYYEYMTARETMRFTARFFYEGPKDEIEARIEDTLKLVAIDDKADRPIKGFSGGERQRLGIAQAYVNHPELLILDEPAASLDPHGPEGRARADEQDPQRDHDFLFHSHPGRRPEGQRHRRHPQQGPAGRPGPHRKAPVRQGKPRLPSWSSRATRRTCGPV